MTFDELWHDVFIKSDRMLDYQLAVRFWNAALNAAREECLKNAARIVATDGTVTAIGNRDCSEIQAAIDELKVKV